MLYFQCLSGISGDMTVGALLDLGIDQDAFRRELAKVKIAGYRVEMERKQKNGISGTKFNVILDKDPQPNQHHGHGDTHSHTHQHRHHSSHRNLHDIEEILDASDLSVQVKALSKQIFGYVAKAEAKVHNKPIEEVHFHEVGAIDSIVDIVGTAICIELLGVDEIYASPLHLGTGFVKCAHGLIPVPAPATLEILKGIPIYSRGIESELVTPTGAAIIKALAKDFGPLPEMIVERIGYGLGQKDLPVTNALRVVMGTKKKLMIS